MATGPAHDEPQPLRLVSYNILDGGADRVEALEATLRLLQPDVIGLCEADDVAVVEQIAARFGMEHLVAESANGPHHVALLTRLPIEQMVNLGTRVELDNAAMQVVLRPAPDAKPLRLILAHLHPGLHAPDEQRRLDELEGLMAVLQDQSPMPTILMGDLNASAPYHPFDPEALPPHRRERLADRNYQVEYTVIQRLLDAGFGDAHRQTHPDTPPPHSFTTADPALRLDYVFLSPDLVDLLADAGVETGGRAQDASDHYPVWTHVHAPAKQR